MTTPFWSPTRLILGAGRWRDVPNQLAACGRRPAVVVDAGALRALPHLHDDLDALGPVLLLIRYATVPTRGEAVALADRLRAHRVDSVCAVGGGATIDLVKLAAAVTTCPELAEGWTGGGFVRPGVRTARPGTAVVAVPTTAGTGSEINPKASVADGGRRRLVVHGILHPAVAVVDPVLHRTVPAGLTAEGALETVARLLVPVVTAPASPVSDEVACTLLRTLLPAVRAVLRDGHDLDARTVLAHICTVSATALHQVGRDQHAYWVWYAVNTLTARGLRKGPALIRVLPRWLHLVAQDASGAGEAARLLRVGRLTLGRPDLASPAAVAETLTKEFSGWGVAAPQERDDPAELARRTRQEWPEALSAQSDDRLMELFGSDRSRR